MSHVSSSPRSCAAALRQACCCLCRATQQMTQFLHISTPQCTQMELCSWACRRTASRTGASPFPSLPALSCTLPVLRGSEVWVGPPVHTCVLVFLGGPVAHPLHLTSMRWSPCGGSPPLSQLALQCGPRVAEQALVSDGLQTQGHVGHAFICAAGVRKPTPLDPCFVEVELMYISGWARLLLAHFLNGILLCAQHWCHDKCTCCLQAGNVM